MSQPAPGFLRDLRDRAKTRQRVLAFPEATEPRVHEALAEALRAQLFGAVLLGPPDEVRAGLERAGVDAGGVEIVDPDDPTHHERCTTRLSEILRERGASLDGVETLARDRLIQAALLVRFGDVDGAVAGAGKRRNGEKPSGPAWGAFAGSSRNRASPNASTH